MTIGRRSSRGAWRLAAYALAAGTLATCSDGTPGTSGAEASRSDLARATAETPHQLGACPGGKSDLLDAAFRGERARLDLCLRSGVPVDAIDGSGSSALDLAIARGHDDIVRLLLERRAPIVQTDSRNPLGVAARDGRGTLVDLLLAAGADPGASWLGKPPLLHAIDRRHDTIALNLLDAGSSPHDRDESGRSALAAAVDVGSSRLVDALLAAGADPTDPCPGGSPLERARQRRDLASIARRLAAAAGESPRAESAEVEPFDQDAEEPDVPADDDPYAKQPPPDLRWPPPPRSAG